VIWRGWRIVTPMAPATSATTTSASTNGSIQAAGGALIQKFLKIQTLIILTACSFTLKKAEGKKRGRTGMRLLFLCFVFGAGILYIWYTVATYAHGILGFG
jgi:hypothetical protein